MCQEIRECGAGSRARQSKGKQGPTRGTNKGDWVLVEISANNTTPTLSHYRPPRTSKERTPRPPKTPLGHTRLIGLSISAWHGSRAGLHFHLIGQAEVIDGAQANHHGVLWRRSSSVSRRQRASTQSRPARLASVRGGSSSYLWTRSRGTENGNRELLPLILLLTPPL